MTEPRWWYCRNTTLPPVGVEIIPHHPAVITIGGEPVHPVPDGNRCGFRHSYADNWTAVHTIRPPRHGVWEPEPPTLDRTPVTDPEGTP